MYFIEEGSVNLESFLVC